MVHLQLLLVFQAYCLFLIHGKLICDSPKPFDLVENEIVFFESPNFPTSMTNETKAQCQLMINGTSDKVKLSI